MSDYVTVSLLRYSGFSNRHWAFFLMGSAPQNVRRANGAQFVRLLGSGANDGFGKMPNFGVYALLIAWRDEAAANAFFARYPLWQEIVARSEEQFTAHLQPTLAHGSWGGETPFATNGDYDPGEPVAVITRATISTKRMLEFWRRVPTIVDSLAEQPGRRISIGIGEYPLFMQATFSLWTSGKAMQHYAYHSPRHREVIAETRRRGWYSEELFSRFRVLRTEGTWADLDRETTPAP
ncbi:MAG: hypothetical protein WBA17_13220 [Saprospiraceae bacterium]